MKDVPITFAEKIWQGTKFAMIFILVVFLTILMAAGGSEAYFSLIGGGSGSTYAEIYGESISDDYRRAVANNFCYQAKSEAQVVACADSVIKNTKQYSQLAGYLNLDINKFFLLSKMKESITKSIKEARAEGSQVDLLGKTDEEIEDIIEDRYIYQSKSSPDNFRKDMYFTPSQGNPGFVFRFLQIAGVAAEADFTTEEKAKKAQLNLQVLAINNSKLLKDIEKTIKVSDFEVKQEFDKRVAKQKKKEAAEKKKAEKAAKDGDGEDGDDKKTKKPKAKAKKLVLNDAEKKKIRNRLKNKKKNDKLKKIKDQIAKLKKDKKLDINQVKNISGAKIFDVESLSLWDIDDFKSAKLEETYKLGKNDKFANLFFSGKVGKTYGPLKVDGKDHYIKITKRDFNAEVVDDAELDQSTTEIQDRQQYIWITQTLPKVQSITSLIKKNEEYIRYYELRQPVNTGQPKGLPAIQ